MTELFALAAITTLLYLSHKVRVWQWSKKPDCTCTDADHNPRKKMDLWTKQEMEEFHSRVAAHYEEVYKAAREIGISHAECLDIETIKFKTDLIKESKG